MGALKLELRCPRNVEGISADPKPDWNFDDVLEELNCLELKLSSSSSKLPLPFAKSQSRDLRSGNSLARSSRPFVMRVSANDFKSDDDEDEDEDEDEDLDRSAVAVTRFNCQEFYLSDEDESEDGFGSEVQPILMDEAGLVEGALFEKTFEHRLSVKGEIRNKISAIESCLTHENEKSNSALLRVVKYREARRDNEKKLDTQYQRKIAEALDSHLTVIQRDHELKSQIEQRKISTAIEGVKRKEKALLEEKLRQEKARAEAEAKIRAEEARKAALEAQIRTEKEAAEREATETAKKAADKAALDEASRKQANASLDGKSSVLSGEIIRAAENALKLEQERLKRLEEIDGESKRLGIDSMKEYLRYEKQISKVVRQISATADIIRKKAAELVNILKTSPFPQSISSRAFARKVILKCQFSGTAFARAYVIVLVCSEVPHLMDVIFAELHKACIYTVPKHIMYSKSTFESREAYYKTIGFKEEEGKIEDVDSYLKELEGYVKLYGALIQTEIPRIQNPHGLKEGWAWMARFVNTLPANRFTAVALNSFLNMAGYALFQKYKSQFGKILIIVSDNFLSSLRDRKDVTLNEIMANIRTYIEDNKFRTEPEGRSLEAASLLSEDVMSASNSHHNNQGYHDNNYYRY